MGGLGAHLNKISWDLSKYVFTAGWVHVVWLVHDAPHANLKPILGIYFCILWSLLLLLLP